MLEDLLCARLPPEGAAWLREALRVAGQGSDQALLARWSAGGRKLGREPLVLTPEERGALEENPGFVPWGWRTDGCGRALLLVRALEARLPEIHVPLVEELYRTGELRERQALLRALSLLPDRRRFLAVALDAVRSSGAALLEAIACENAYPALCFPEEAFNQMVLQVLFSGLALRRVYGLDGRRTPELLRMVQAFASERKAAGRPIPRDVSWIIEGGSRAAV